MTQIAIGYGRKSFDDPENRTSSVSDQEMFARKYAVQHTFELVAFHADNGITGATMQRPGLQAVLATIRAGKAQVLIIEDVDRLGRDQEHLAYMRKMFAAYDVVLHTVVAGRIDDLTFAFKSVIGEDQRRRIAYMTRRGLIAKAARGGTTGGKTLGYVRDIIGYEADGSVRDKYVIIEQEADLVRLIFTLYADGWSLKRICAWLDEGGVPPIRARKKDGRTDETKRWNPSTLSGHPEHGEGVLNNPMYVGERRFNRRNWKEIPNEDRGFFRSPRQNAEEDWIRPESAELRIIDQELWDKVKARQAEARAARDAKFKITKNPLAGAKRPGHLLSGLVRCGVCDGPFVATGGRWRCKAAMRQACSNSSIRGEQLEARALEGLRSRLLTPEVIGRFAQHLQRELDVQQRAAHGRRDAIETALEEARVRIAKIVKRIEEDEDAPRSLSARLKELEAEELQLDEELAALPDRMVVRLVAIAGEDSAPQAVLGRMPTSCGSGTTLAIVAKRRRSSQDGSVDGESRIIRHHDLR